MLNYKFICRKYLLMDRIKTALKHIKFLYEKINSFKFIMFDKFEREQS